MICAHSARIALLLCSANVLFRRTLPRYQCTPFSSPTIPWTPPSYPNGTMRLISGTTAFPLTLRKPVGRVSRRRLVWLFVNWLFTKQILLWQMEPSVLTGDCTPTCGPNYLIEVQNPTWEVALYMSFVSAMEALSSETLEDTFILSALSSGFTATISSTRNVCEIGHQVRVFRSFIRRLGLCGRSADKKLPEDWRVFLATCSLCGALWAHGVGHSWVLRTNAARKSYKKAWTTQTGLQKFIR